MSSSTVPTPSEGGRISAVARIGTFLVLVGALIVGGTILTGQFGIGRSDGSAWLSSVGLVLLGLGVAAFAVTPPRPHLYRSSRLALAVLAVGLICVAISSFAATGTATDPLASMAVVVPLVVGYVATPIGLLMVALLVPRSVFRRR